MSQSVVLHFEFVEGVDPEAATAEVEAALAKLDQVEESEASPDDERLGIAEAALLITAAVTLVRSGRELTDELALLARSVRRLIGEVKALKGVTVEVGDHEVDVNELADATAPAGER